MDFNEPTDVMSATLHASKCLAIAPNCTFGSSRDYVAFEVRQLGTHCIELLTSDDRPFHSFCSQFSLSRRRDNLPFRALFMWTRYVDCLNVECLNVVRRPLRHDHASLTVDQCGAHGLDKPDRRPTGPTSDGKRLKDERLVDQTTRSLHCGMRSPKLGVMGDINSAWPTPDFIAFFSLPVWNPTSSYVNLYSP